MADAKTVDNLGPQVHQRYIEDTRFLSKEELAKLAPSSIAKKVEVLETAAKPLETDLLFKTKESESSPFAPPEDFVLGLNVFTSSIAPNMGTLEEIQERLNSLNKTDLSDKEKNQMKTLNKSFARINLLDKMLQDVKKRSNEYQKG